MEGHRARLSGFLFFVEIQGWKKGVKSWWTRGKKAEYKLSVAMVCGWTAEDIFIKACVRKND